MQAREGEAIVAGLGGQPHDHTRLGEPGLADGRAGPHRAVPEREAEAADLASETILELHAASQRVRPHEIGVVDVAGKVAVAVGSDLNPGVGDVGQFGPIEHRAPAVGAAQPAGVCADEGGRDE